MPDSSETGETGGKSATGRDRAPRAAPATRLSDFATNRHESCGLDRHHDRLFRPSAIDLTSRGGGKVSDTISLSEAHTEGHKWATRAGGRRLRAVTSLSRSTLWSRSSCPIPHRSAIRVSALPGLAEPWQAPVPPVTSTPASPPPATSENPGCPCFWFLSSNSKCNTLAQPGLQCCTWN